MHYPWAAYSMSKLEDLASSISPRKVKIKGTSLSPKRPKFYQGRISNLCLLIQINWTIDKPRKCP